MVYSLYVLIFIFGLCLGSFLNVVINRLELKESIVIKRSYCPKCKKVLQWYDLIPVLSFVLLRRQCRYCHKKISWQYPLVEIATGLLFLLVFLSASWNGDFQLINIFYYLIITSILIVIFVYDLKYYIILDKIIFPAIVITLLYRLVIFSDLMGLIYPILAALLAGGFFLSLVLVSHEKWMGLGDVKLGVLMGLILGWPRILPALFLSFTLGAVVGIALILLKKKKIKSEIPFGPFLSLATFVILLYGNKILDWYLKLLW